MVPAKPISNTRRCHVVRRLVQLAVLVAVYQGTMRLLLPSKALPAALPVSAKGTAHEAAGAAPATPSCTEGGAQEPAPLPRKGDFAIVIYTAKKDVEKIKKTIVGVKGVGKYTGEIVLMLGSDIEPDSPEFKFFEQSGSTLVSTNDLLPKLEQEEPKCEGEMPSSHKRRWTGFDRLGIWNHTYWRQWDRILFFEGSMEIHNPLQPLLNIDCKGRLVAQSNEYPYQHHHSKWGISKYFNKECNASLYKELEQSFDLTRDSFTTFIMLMDTSILTKDTVHEILDLVFKFGPLMQSYQNVVGLYFTQVTRQWRVLPAVQENSGWIYDYYPRVADKNHYRLTKIVIGSG